MPHILTDSDIDKLSVIAARLGTEDGASSDHDCDLSGECIEQGGSIVMQYTAIPKSATLIKSKHGVLIDPDHGPFEGKPASLYWYRLLTGNQDKHYIVVYRDGVRILRKQATGKNVKAWASAYDDIAAVIDERAQ